MHRIFAYLELGLYFILIISLFYLPFLLTLKKRGHSPVRQLAWLGLGCAVFLIIFAAFLFMPIRFGPGNHFSCNLVPLRVLWTENGLRLLLTEKIPNVLLFMPLGLFLPLVFGKLRSLRQTALLALGLTCGIEFIQFFIGRSADIDDVICNFAGAVIGYGCYKAAEKLLGRTGFWRKLLGAGNPKHLKSKEAFLCKKTLTCANGWPCWRPLSLILLSTRAATPWRPWASAPLKEYACWA